MSTAAAVHPNALFPILRRRRRDQPQPVAFGLVKPALRLKLREQLANDDDGFTFEDRQAVRAGLQDNDLLEAAYQKMDVEMQAPDRDWNSFGEFLAKIIPLIIQAIKELLPIFMGGGIPLPSVT